MKKGLIIALAVVLVLGLSGIAMAWDFDVWGKADSSGPGDASVFIGGAGGVDGPCPFDVCPLTKSYEFEVEAGIVNGTGTVEADGLGWNGFGFTELIVSQFGGGCGEAVGEAIFANQSMEATVCQTGCVVDLYEADTNVSYLDGNANIWLRQGTGVVGPFTDLYPTSGQTVETTSAGVEVGLFSLAMTATKTDIHTLDSETHKMNMGGTNVVVGDRYIEGYQGMDSCYSEMYGWLSGVLYYGDPDDGCDPCDPC